MISSALIKKLSGQYDESVIQRLNFERHGIAEIKNLFNCKALIDLSLASNDITNISGIEALTELKRLDLSFNKIRTVDSLESNAFCETLVFLDLRGNKIENIGDIHNLISLVALRTLYFRGCEGEDANPCCSHASYPAVVIQTLTLLQILDGAHLKVSDCPFSAIFLSHLFYNTALWNMRRSTTTSRQHRR